MLLQKRPGVFRPLRSPGAKSDDLTLVWQRNVHSTTLIQSSGSCESQPEIRSGLHDPAPHMGRRPSHPNALSVPEIG